MGSSSGKPSRGSEENRAQQDDGGWDSACTEQRSFQAKRGIKKRGA